MQTNHSSFEKEMLRGRLVIIFSTRKSMPPSRSVAVRSPSQVTRGNFPSAAIAGSSSHPRKVVTVGIIIHRIQLLLD
ncbi:hypothetical protein ACHAXA_002082 [Cyclostephanos tholiformis]|uniref:Uncharacterized protein n=1 Tax=Cyclostephanos tholiformis TaxID=382380 RepID=A0ABD3SSI9_9STRA